MKEYLKIQSIFKRCDEGKGKGKFIEGNWSMPEFEYLKDNQWIWTEKVDGTNIRIMWDTKEVRFGGKTDDAQIPIFLLRRLQDLFPLDKFKSLYPEASMCLYGEGFGARIQEDGGNYIPNGVDFILFDVLVDSWWLERENIEDVAQKLGIKVVPIVGEGSIQSAIDTVKSGLKSRWGEFKAEGLVLKPRIELYTRAGHRIITKLKYKDFAGYGEKKGGS